eukprot:m.15137 g.15137  ORF g.15137 m.15137 type:complete len:395 (+) comp10454_c0_seq1:308-1492(+)
MCNKLVMANPTAHCQRFGQLVLTFSLVVMLTTFALAPPSASTSSPKINRSWSETFHDLNRYSHKTDSPKGINTMNSNTSTVRVDVAEEPVWNAEDCERTKRAVRGCGWVCSGPNGVRGLKTNASSPWKIGTNETAVACSECHAARWTGCGCHYIFATFPFTGNTWIRNFWDIATGIGTQSMYPEGGQRSTTSDAYASVCGTNRGKNHVAAWNTKKTAVLELLRRINPDSEPTLSFGADQTVTNVCDLVRTAKPSDPMIIKTHLPRPISPRSELDRFVGKNLVCGIIHTVRTEVDSWCRSHGTGVSWWNNATECPHVVSKMMQGDADFWHSVQSEGGPLAGVPVLTLNFTEMTTGDDPTVVENSIQKLFAFTNTTVDPRRLQLASLLHGSGSKVK